MQGRGTGRNYTNIICKEKSVEANVELRHGLHQIVRKLPAFGNRRTRSTYNVSGFDVFAYYLEYMHVENV